MKVIFSLLVLLFPALALAQAIPHPDENLGEVVGIIVSAFQGGNWFAGGALVIMLIVWFLGKYVRNPDLLPFFAGGIGMLLAAASSALGGRTWYEASLAGLLTGGGSTLLWSTLGKRYLPKLFDPGEPAPELDEKKEEPK